jgi:transcriptional regulator with XRE-family HTH domain
MSPFANHLLLLRRSRGLKQKDLADLMGIGTSYLCALESGRKEPPSASQLARMAAALQLNQDEQRMLVEVADVSRRSLAIPSDASIEEYEVAHAFVGRLGQLTHEEVDLIKLVLKINAKRQPVPNTALESSMPRVFT